MLDVAGYLRRLGIDQRRAGPLRPTVALLVAAHQAHVERVAYTTIDIHLGQPGSIDAHESAGRIVATGRGGYCFHLNGALAALLDGLGFQVRRHRGGVWSGAGDTPLRPRPNHLALTVHGLPAEEAPDGVWFVDAGLGDGPHAPVPLRAGEFRQGSFRYELGPSPVLAGGWRFRHDPNGSFDGMDFEPRAAGVADFAAAHAHLSTSPESSFVRWLSAQRRDAAGVDKLVSCTLRRIEAGTVTDRFLETPRQWFGALADVFGLTLADVEAGRREALWRRAYAAQLAWLAAGAG